VIVTSAGWPETSAGQTLVAGRRTRGPALAGRRTRGPAL